MPGVVSQHHQYSPGYPYSNTGATELQSTPHQAQQPSELYTAQMHHQTQPSELQDANYYSPDPRPAELHSPIPSRGLDSLGQSPPYGPIPTQPQYYQYQSPPDQQPEPQELHPASPAPTTRSMQQLSPEAIAVLQDEERRIEEEMEDVRRMKELREQKFAIQKKLREAKGV
ncbi:hypothetical protein K458DRAFT_414574 [Lentithecium fluviatile CBS 122367]|uniref:Uncharacterized protein n=1 Tax=Lentithecium fluviatile CBS 122367 TaxID=1168545 RepID=A0A6G1JE82_9PLEO|nr:hypothetical protein K458DRAFT_414574 [Lentithecium fluviatile CBS 122367]